MHSCCKPHPSLARWEHVGFLLGALIPVGLKFRVLVQSCAHVGSETTPLKSLQDQQRGFQAAHARRCVHLAPAAFRREAIKSQWAAWWYSVKTSAFPRTLVIFHGSAELLVAKDSRMNLHFQREFYFPAKSECTFVATAAYLFDTALARLKHYWLSLNVDVHVVTVEKLSEKLLNVCRVAVLNSLLNNEQRSAVLPFSVRFQMAYFCAMMNFNNCCKYAISQNEAERNPIIELDCCDWNL